MAEIIPPLNTQTLSHMTNGEKRFARRLLSFLEDDYLVWYDIPVGNERRYPDFIILHPARGLLFLEVKDWKPSTLKKLSKSSVTLLTPDGLKKVQHPLEQARDCTYQVLSKIQKDPLLCHKNGRYQGKLIMPWGWGCVFTNISRKQIEKAIPETIRENILPDHLMIYQNDMLASADAERFQEQLWGMFHYRFGKTLTLPEIDRLRWHLFPEIRIDDGVLTDELFISNKVGSSQISNSLPDIVKVMDIRQEKLARGLGEGHRVVHGVAGSGKTLILGCRCQYLIEETDKPILVLCFNITLAAKIRSFISEKGVGGQVQVYHFHDWCGQQLKTYHVDVKESKAPPYYERQVEAVIDGVDKGYIPRAQYGALLVDEGHDFAAEWLRLVVQMIDPKTDSLLLLYDDAQSIYDNRSGLDFSLSSVGVKAQGRTTILRLNYRNTHEILSFAYSFASHYLDIHKADDDHVPIIEPKAAGSYGPNPEICKFDSFDEEITYTLKCLKIWHDKGVLWGDMAILYCGAWQGNQLASQLAQERIPHLLMKSKKHKNAYNPAKNLVTLSTIHSSKGLEFNCVIIIGVGQMKDNKERKLNNARLLYVGMTRAQKTLLMTTSTANEYSLKLLNISAKMHDQ